MDITDESKISIHLVLRKLIEEKSKRDHAKFTACQLAEALDMPRSIITKLTHPDKSKRVTNPRIDTLLKIVDFFRSDGINITLEDLLGLEKKTIGVRNQPLPQKLKPIIVPVYQLNKINNKLGQIEVSLTDSFANVIALYADRDIKPFFKTGSIFIINTIAKLEDDVLVAIRLPNQVNTLIRKYSFYNNNILFKALDEHENDIVLMPTISVMIIGVVVQVNAKT